MPMAEVIIDNELAEGEIESIYHIDTNQIKINLNNIPFKDSFTNYIARRYT